MKLFNLVAQLQRAKIANTWENNFIEFERYVGMPKERTTLYNWKHDQLSNVKTYSLKAKIRKEKAENKGSTEWFDRGVKFSNLVAQKSAHRPRRFRGPGR